MIHSHFCIAMMKDYMYFFETAKFSYLKMNLIVIKHCESINVGHTSKSSLY